MIFTSCLKTVQIRAFKSLRYRAQIYVNSSQKLQNGAGITTKQIKKILKIKSKNQHKKKNKLSETVQRIGS